MACQLVESRLVEERAFRDRSATMASCQALEAVRRASRMVVESRLVEGRASHSGVRRVEACQAILPSVSARSNRCQDRVLPGNPGGGGKAPAAPACNMGFACPSAAYEDVIESMTDCAFSCPISVKFQYTSSGCLLLTHADSIPPHSSDDSFQHYAPSGQTSSRASGRRRNSRRRI